MADISKFSIVTYERKPGHWRAAITRRGTAGSAVRGDTVLSVVTPDDYASESEADCSPKAHKTTLIADDQRFRKLSPCATIIGKEIGVVDRVAAVWTPALAEDALDVGFARRH